METKTHNLCRVLDSCRGDEVSKLPIQIFLTRLAGAVVARADSLPIIYWFSCVSWSCYHIKLVGACGWHDSTPRGDEITAHAALCPRCCLVRLDGPKQTLCSYSLYLRNIRKMIKTKKIGGHHLLIIRSQHMLYTYTSLLALIMSINMMSPTKP